MSTPDTFRDALARRLHQQTHDECEGCEFDDPCTDEDGWVGEAYVNYTGAADAVLASDEMQTLRLVARGSFTVHQLRLLHPSVRAWVLDDPLLDSPTDKPCETCGGYGRIPASACPSCRGGEPT